MRSSARSKLTRLLCVGRGFRAGRVPFQLSYLDHYATRGRNIIAGPLAVDGRANPNKSPLVRPMQLDAGDRADLVACLESLTDHGASCCS
jgi:hypothetical protein